MNDFERQVREAISAARNGARQAEQSLTNPIWQAKSSMASLGGALTRQGMMEDTPSQEAPAKTENDTTVVSPINNQLSQSNGAAPVQNNSARFKETPEMKTGRSGSTRSLHERPGLLHGHWDNPYISAAMPLLLLLEELRNHPGQHSAEIRPPIVRELQYFQQNLLNKNYPLNDINHLSYLLCTYIDAIFTGLQVSDNGGQSLLVEFHRDAWGGEDCFEHLRTYMESPKQSRQVLEFYDLIICLGFEGKYQILEHGAVLLADLRSRLHTLLYGQGTLTSLSLAQPSKGATPKRYISALKIFNYGLLICLCVYAATAWYLHQQSRYLRGEILAWVLPEPRKINVMETLPNPLSNLMKEGWLEVRKYPLGWLLIFTSDGAFRTGEATLSEEFRQKRNIERLGEALSPWPGDLEVIGHTDNKPFRNTSGNNNLKLSAARASVVADKIREVISNNSDAIQREITAVGRGDTEPLADNSTEDGRRRNRRVDILWKIGQRDADQALQQFHEGTQAPK